MRDGFEEEIIKTIKALAGFENLLYPNQMYLHIFVQQIVDSYRDPLKSGIQAIKGIMTNAIDASCKEVLDGYPKFQERVLYLVKTNLNDCEQDTIGKSNFLFRISPLNGNHLKVSLLTFFPTTRGRRGALY